MKDATVTAFRDEQDAVPIVPGGVTLQPDNAIVPLFAMSGNNNIHGFLGTAAFVGARNRLLTAEHVVRGWNREFGIVASLDISTVHHAVLLKVDQGRDLALLETTALEAKRALELARSDRVNSNSQVVCFEYGTTQVSGTSITLNPATRLGNVTRDLDLTELYGPAGRRMLELSFPALKGASGAPVLSNGTFELWGVIKANVSYELLPAQVESVHDQSGTVPEETKFFLPQALAVNRAVVEEFLLNDSTLR